MHRSAAVACAQVTTVFLHLYMISHNTGWMFTDLICHLPAIIFLFGATAIIRICQLVPIRFLIGLNQLHQFTLQYLTSLLALNVCLHGLWFNIETFVTYILPRLLDHLISLNLGPLWFGILEIQEKVWTTILSTLVATSFLAMITPFIHKYERSLGRKSSHCSSRLICSERGYYKKKKSKTKAEDDSSDEEKDAVDSGGCIYCIGCCCLN